MHTLLQDLRYSARQLVKNPGFTLTAVVSLALGIGTTSAVFSVIYAVLMNPYPYPRADRMVRLTTESVAGSGIPSISTEPKFKFCADHPWLKAFWPWTTNGRC